MDCFERATESVIDDMPHGNHPFKLSLKRSVPGGGLERATEGLCTFIHVLCMLGVVGCAEISFRGIAFYKVTLHVFADAGHVFRACRCSLYVMLSDPNPAGGLA